MVLEKIAIVGFRPEFNPHKQKSRINLLFSDFRLGIVLQALKVYTTKTWAFKDLVGSFEHCKKSVQKQRVPTKSGPGHDIKPSFFPDHGLGSSIVSEERKECSTKNDGVFF